MNKNNFGVVIGLNSNIGLWRSFFIFLMSSRSHNVPEEVPLPDVLRVFTTEINDPKAFCKENPPATQSLQQFLNIFCRRSDQIGLYDRIRCKVDAILSDLRSTMLSSLECDHIIALHAYTMEESFDDIQIQGVWHNDVVIYKAMNQALRTHKYLFWNPLLVVLADAFRRCSSYKPRNLFVGLKCIVPDKYKNMPPKDHEEPNDHPPQDKYYLRDFRSSSILEKKAKAHGELILRFDSAIAIPLTKISAFPDEKEWLIAPTALNKITYTVQSYSNQKLQLLTNPDDNTSVNYS
ncbi:hypothetical protein P9112_010967 [Eukaryota sp. TZLM1-RC]